MKASLVLKYILPLAMNAFASPAEPPQCASRVLFVNKSLELHVVRGPYFQALPTPKGGKIVSIENHPDLNFSAVVQDGKTEILTPSLVGGPYSAAVGSATDVKLDLGSAATFGPHPKYCGITNISLVCAAQLDTAEKRLDTWYPVDSDEKIPADCPFTIKNDDQFNQKN